RVLSHQGEQPPVWGDAAHHRQVVPRLPDAQDWCVPAGGIGSHSSGQQIEARFVHKNQGSAFQARLFFSSAQTSVRHRAMAASSCVRATAIQWLTAPFVTPTAVAIYCCRQPLRLNSKARKRRSSFQAVVGGLSFGMSWFSMPKKFRKL